MSSEDPFDKVLRQLGLYEDVEQISPAIVETKGNAQHCCRIQVMDINGTPATIQQATDAIRLTWALKLIKFVRTIPHGQPTVSPMNLILILDGAVQVRRVLTQANVYSPRYRIPPSSVGDLPCQERVWRAEKFALGVLLYKIFTGHEIFEEMDEHEVQERYAAGEFPPDAMESIQPLCFQSLIYACWSAEFGHYITQNKFSRYVSDNPLRFALQVTGAVVSAAALVTVPVLGAIGFGVLGPIAGTAAAAWQASIGMVEAGSLFAICQSAAMGGAAATALATTATAGAGVTMAATSLREISLSLREIFKKTFRKGRKD